MTGMFAVYWLEEDTDNGKWVQRRVRFHSLTNAREYAASVKADYPVSVGVCVKSEQVEDEEVWL